MDMKILIVEDDQTQNTVLANFLRKETYQVQSAFSLADARELLDDSIHLIILDIMLPDGNGLEFLKEIRTHSDVPVIVLTALDDEFTQINSFDLKADEYVDKPVSPVVMTKRIKALLERIYIKPKTVELCGFQFNFEKYMVTDSEAREIQLTTKEFNIIKYLYENKGNPVSREQLLNLAWGYEYISEDRLIDTHIRNIRKKLCANLIITIKSVGYRLNI